MRDLSYRRHHTTRIKDRVRRRLKFLRPQGTLVESYYDGDLDKRVTLRLTGDPGPEEVGKAASVHLKGCSCYMCGNPRRHFGAPTIQELRQTDDPFTGNRY